jgi:hypothetical protein
MQVKRVDRRGVVGIGMIWRIREDKHGSSPNTTESLFSLTISLSTEKKGENSNTAEVRTDSWHHHGKGLGSCRIGAELPGMLLLTSIQPHDIGVLSTVVAKEMGSWSH